ncbi:hypothetical protein [Cuspidothrix issatschenkoi]|nr:hypothetical protein [Cuspidothrix issatschenkoi]
MNRESYLYLLLPLTPIIGKRSRWQSVALAIPLPPAFFYNC